MSRSVFDPPEHGHGGMPQLMFPRLTPAVKFLIIANVAIQLVTFLTRGALASWLGLSILSFERFPLLGVANLLTYQFVHSYALGHVLMNMLVLYFFGTMVEGQIGSRRFLRLYLASGVVGGLFWLGFAALTGNADVPCVGASGACYGVLAYAAWRNPNAPVIFIIVFLRLWWLAAIFGVLALYNTVSALRGDLMGGGVADAAHLGGMVYASLYFKFGAGWAALGERLSARAAAAEAERQRQREKELDRLLQKINEVGMAGLSGRERRFLARYSKDRRK